MNIYILFFLLLLNCANYAYSSPEIPIIENKFYSVDDKNAIKVSQYIQNSDCEIRVHSEKIFSLYRINNDEVKEKVSKVSLSVISRDFDEKMNRKLLVFNCDKGVVPDNEDDKEVFLESIISQFNKFRFQRILIVGKSGHGIHVYVNHYMNEKAAADK